MDCRKHIHIKQLPKHPIWNKIEKLGFASHGSHGRRVTNWCNPFTGPPEYLLK